MILVFLLGEFPPVWPVFGLRVQKEALLVARDYDRQSTG